MAATAVRLEWSDGFIAEFAVGESYDGTVTANTSGQVRARFIDDSGNAGPWTGYVQWSVIVASLNFFAPELVDASLYLDASVVG